MKKTLATVGIGGALLFGGTITADQLINPYDIVGTKLEIQADSVLLEGGAQKTVVETTEPKITLEKWNGEVSLGITSLDLPSDTIGSRPLLSKNVEWQSGDIKMEAVPLDPTTGMENGGMEINLILNSHPALNTFTFQLQNWENLDFEYQPPLWQEAGLKEPTKDCTDTDCPMAGGVAHRPENIVDSFAVYYKDHKDHIEGETNYANGKAYQIYRSQVSDSSGQLTWATLTYANGVLSLTVPQDFLDTAVYPVKVDPTFGNTVAGGTIQCVGSDELETVKFTSPAGGGNITSLSYSAGTGCGSSFTAGNAIYSDSASAPTNLLAQDSGNVTVNATQQYWTTNVAYTFTGSTPYWLTVFIQSPGGVGDYYYDASGASMFFLSATFESYPNPWVGGTALNRNVSIYATYSPLASVSQTAYRFRNDNGNETTATWFAAENTDVTYPKSTNLRARLQASTTGDLPADLFLLEFKKTTNTVWRPVGTTTTAITFVATSTTISGSTSLAQTYPVGIKKGDLLLYCVESKPFTATIVTPAGWGVTTGAQGGQGANGADTGSTTTKVFTKESDGTESGTFTESITTGNSSIGVVSAYRRGSGQFWATSTVAATDNLGNTNWSAATTTALTFQPFDVITTCSGVNTDAAGFNESPTLTASGATFNTETKIASTSTATGNDTALVMSHHFVTTGTDAAPTLTWTVGGQAVSRPAGGTVFVRLRQTDNAIQLSPSANITNTGDNTTAQLSVPGGKSFTAGQMNDTKNPTDSIDIASDNYSEFEWNIIATTTVANGDIYQLRVTKNGTLFDAYTVTPNWTIGAIVNSVVNLPVFNTTVQMNVQGQLKI